MPDGTRLGREVRTAANTRLPALALALALSTAACAHWSDAARRDVVVTVALDGSGQYTSVNAALAAAPEGAVVRIGPGTFEERVLVTKPVTIEGAGPDRTTIFSTLTPRERKAVWDECQKEIAAAASDDARAALQARLMVRQSELLGATLRVQGARGVAVRGLTLSAIGERPEGGSLPGCVVDVARSLLTMEGCAIVGSPGSGVSVGPGADVAIDGCLVGAVADTGISVSPQREEPSTVRIVGSDIRNCRHRGIVVGAGNGAVTIEGCRISGSSWHGIRYDSASPTVRGNVIFGNVRSGIYASGTTAGRIEGNLFFRNGMSDVSCWYDAKDVIEGNTFVESHREAVAILGASAPVVRNNVFAGCKTAITGGGIADGGAGFAFAGGATLEQNFGWECEALSAFPKESATRAEFVVADPQFTDAARRDYSLARSSNAGAARAGAASPLTFESPWAAQPEETATAPKEDPAASLPLPAAKSPTAAPAPAKPAADPLEAVARAKADILQIEDAARRERGLVALGELLRADDPSVARAALASLHDLRDVKYDKRRFRPEVMHQLSSADRTIATRAAYALQEVEREPGDLDRVLAIAEAASVPPGDLLFVALNLNQRRADGRLAKLFVKALAVDDGDRGAMDTANCLRSMWVAPEVDDAVVAAWRRHPTGRNGHGLWPYVLGQMTSPAQDARVRAIFEMLGAENDDSARQLAGPAITRAVNEDAKPVAAKLAAEAIPTAKTASLRRTYLDVIRANGSRAEVPALRALSENDLVGDDLREAARKVADDLDR